MLCQKVKQYKNLYTEFFLGAFVLEAIIELRRQVCLYCV